MEKCPKCGSIFIQLDNTLDQCYCLVKSCGYRWFQKLTRKSIKNIYLRTSMWKEVV